jgi:hypothetical protein
MSIINLLLPLQEILAETKLGFNLVFTEYGNEQV